MDNETLLPCPVCGGADIVWECDENDRHSYFCEDCGGAGTVSASSQAGAGEVQDERAMFEAWARTTLGAGYLEREGDEYAYKLCYLTWAAYRAGAAGAR